MQGFDGFLDPGVRLQHTPSSKGIQPSIPVCFFGLQFFVQRASQDAKLITEPDMVTGQIASSGWQIMGGDRGQTVLAPLLRRQRRTVPIPVELEPQDRRSQDAAFPK